MKNSEARKKLEEGKMASGLGSFVSKAPALFKSTGVL
jgi:hypothetical protein